MLRPTTNQEIDCHTLESSTKAFTGRLMPPRRFAPMLTVVLFALCNATTALAATYGVSANGALRMGGGVPGLFAIENTGWQATAPAVIDIADAQTSPAGASISSQMHVNTSYGVITASGDGTVTNAPYQGSILWQHTGARGGDPNGHFFDQLTVSSDSLAAGTPVTVSFSLLMQGHVFGSYNDGPNAGADVVGSLYVSTIDPNHPWLTVGLSEEIAYDTFQNGVIQTKVGNTFQIQGRLGLGMYADANGSVPLGQVRTRTFNYDTKLLFGIESTPGTYLLADSGTQYISSVPLPESWVMLLTGMCLIGIFAKTRSMTVTEPSPINFNLA